MSVIVLGVGVWWESAYLRDTSPPSVVYLNTLPLQLQRQLLIRKRLARIFFFNQLLHTRFNRTSGKSPPSGPFTPSEKKNRNS